MKKFVFIVVSLLMVFVFDTKIFDDTIYNLYINKKDNKDLRIISNPEMLNKNEYYKEKLSSYVEEMDEFIVHNKQELINVYYTAINNGYDDLTFYCDENYIDCDKDINTLDNENDNFSYINQLVGVYNTYFTIESTYSSNLRVDINITKKYSKEDIEKINKRLDELIEELNINSYSLEAKIKVFHDYIANNTKYDKEMAEYEKSEYQSDSAIGPLFEGYAVCSGYTDLMALFLDKLNLVNVRVATNNHVWNAVLIDNEWKHIDLTWDDPVTSDGSDIIIYDYYLLTTEELILKDDDTHILNTEVYNFL